MNLASVKKVTFVVNTAILLIVLGLAAFFALCGATFLLWFSIPTAMVYLIGYVLIYYDKLTAYARIVYFWLPLYMCITTICLGYEYGFHLYCFSVILTAYVSDYIGYKLKMKRISAPRISLMTGILYLLATGYVAYFGAIYDCDQKYAAVFWLVNAVSVLGFLIFYTDFLIKSIIASEEKLIEAAHVDRLTHLYNRHYMITRLEEIPADGSQRFLAMSDIDNFKKINDTYGHNGGDEVLKAISGKMQAVCQDCEIARWGGEEFLILSDKPLHEALSMLERLRSNIECEPVSFDGQEIHVTITIGIAAREPEQTIDAWVQSADNKLYFGKNHGKNRVIQ